MGRFGSFFLTHRDFLGYHFCPAGLRVADVTWDRFIEKATRLYEQERAAPEGAAVLGLYVQRWVRWTGAGLAGLKKAPPKRGNVYGA